MAEKKATKHAAHHWADLFDREFKGESDRASVILAAAMIDSILDTLLRTRLVAEPSGDDSLLDGHNSPIGTFSARIDLSYRIGVISAKMARDLHILRKIRNEFAHNIVGCTFESPSVRSRISELMKSSGLAKRAPDVRNGFPDGPRGDLQFSLSWIVFSLAGRTEHIVPIEAANIEFGYEAPYAEPTVKTSQST